MVLFLDDLKIIFFSFNGKVLHEDEDWWESEPKEVGD
jgi:hypothetical protein